MKTRVRYSISLLSFQAMCGAGEGLMLVQLEWDLH